MKTCNTISTPPPTHTHTQALRDSQEHIQVQCATSGTAESWNPLDLSEDRVQLVGKCLMMFSSR